MPKRLSLKVFALCLTVLAPAGAVVAGDESLESFAARIAEAFAPSSADARAVKIAALFHKAGLDSDTEKLLERSSRHLARLENPSIAFEELPVDADVINVLDGYEYAPNLPPLGYLVLTEADARPGNHTRIFYARTDDDGGLVIPAVTRRLINPDAEPDKLLQMLAMGIAHPALTFEGWCDLALSNGKTERVRLDDQGIGNQTIIMRAQRILACELTNTAQEGRLSLTLLEDDREIFRKAVDYPETIIRYAP